MDNCTWNDSRYITLIGVIVFLIPFIIQKIANRKNTNDKKRNRKEKIYHKKLKEKDEEFLQEESFFIQ